MGFRNAGVRVLLLAVIVVLSWYTFTLYKDLYRNFQIKQDASVTTAHKEQAESKKQIGSTEIKQVDDPDNLINKDILKKAEEEWDRSNIAVPDVTSRTPCSTEKCAKDEFSFKLISGAANVIGPSICFNDTILMKNSLNNVDRGMNVARVDRRLGKLDKSAVFDLYSKDSSELKAFLLDLEEYHIVLISSYDDAASRLDDEARKMLEKIGSKKSKVLSFRDNWIFVGGKTLENSYEGHMANNRETNKYGDWPAAITIQGCLPAAKKS